MQSTIAIEIPREIIHAARMKPIELKQELAIHLFQQGRLSFGKARQLADMSAWVFQQLLGSRGIPMHYNIDEYTEDMAALKEMARIGKLTLLRELFGVLIGIIRDSALFNFRLSHGPFPSPSRGRDFCLTL
jgi:predicted HTH domain antitoxin